VTVALLTWEDGIVKIDGEALPGLLVDQSVDGQVKFDEQGVDGQSGKKRTPLGWEDTEVSLTLVLTTDAEGQDCYEKLEAINAIFRGHDAQANPKVYEVVNRHLQARGVGKLIFSALSSVETDEDDVITAGLSFVEHNPPVVKTETSVAKSALATAKKAKSNTEAALDLARKDDELARLANTPAVKPGVAVDLT